jgi:chromosome segregation ATPase
MDARTKAISDALEDINGAKAAVADMERRVEQAREDVSILRVDAELEKKRLRGLESRRAADPQRIRSELRRLERRVDDAARALRYAQKKLQMSREDLQDLQQRHWAVLRFYDPDQAVVGVNDALRELEENEPAVRRFRERVGNDSAGSDTTSTKRDNSMGNNDSAAAD